MLGSVGSFPLYFSLSLWFMKILCGLPIDNFLKSGMKVKVLAKCDWINLFVLIELISRLLYINS